MSRKKDIGIAGITPASGMRATKPPVESTRLEKTPKQSASRIANLGTYAHPAKKGKKK